MKRQIASLLCLPLIACGTHNAAADQEQLSYVAPITAAGCYVLTVPEGLRAHFPDTVGLSTELTVVEMPEPVGFHMLKLSDRWAARVASRPYWSAFDKAISFVLSTDTSNLSFSGTMSRGTLAGTVAVQAWPRDTTAAGWRLFRQYESATAQRLPTDSLIRLRDAFTTAWGAMVTHDTFSVSGPRMRCLGLPAI